MPGSCEPAVVARWSIRKKENGSGSRYRRFAGPSRRDMSGISDALKSSANHLLSLERSLAIIQSNVGNASTPGYARQDLGAAINGATADPLQQQSSRDEFAETAVRR